MVAAERGLVYFQGAGKPGGKLFGHFLDRVLAHKPDRSLRVAYSLAAASIHPDAMSHLARFMVPRNFRGATLERFSVDGEGDAQPAAAARAIVERADLIFLSGGDPVAGCELLRAAGADAWLRDARARGAALSGGSAGAIMLGAWWARWPEAPDGRPFDGGVLVPATGVVEDLVVDTHAEEDDWDELRLVHGMLRARGLSPRLRGVPTYGALIVDGDNRIEVLGDPPLVIE